MKPKAFWFHYNKPASAKAGCPILTVHHKKQCLLVKGVTCLVPIESRIRKNQPRCVMAGTGVVRVVDQWAYITDGPALISASA